MNCAFAKELTPITDARIGDCFPTVKMNQPGSFLLLLHTSSWSGIYSLRKPVQGCVVCDRYSEIYTQKKLTIFSSKHYLPSGLSTLNQSINLLPYGECFTGRAHGNLSIKRLLRGDVGHVFIGWMDALWYSIQFRILIFIRYKDAHYLQMILKKTYFTRFACHLAHQSILLSETIKSDKENSLKSMLLWHECQGYTASCQRALGGY